MIMNKRHASRKILPVELALQCGETHIEGSTMDISRKGLCMNIPTPRIKGHLLDLLHKDVTLEIKNETIDGNIRWYTLDETSYIIGISIDKRFNPQWKRIMDSTPSPH